MLGSDKSFLRESEYMQPDKLGSKSFTECQQKISLSTNVDGKLNIEEGKPCSPQQQRSEDF